MKTEGNGTQQVQSNNIRRFVQRLPFTIALVFGTIWGLLYLSFGWFHSMWSMFDDEFPFLIPSLLGMQKGSLSPGVGALLAFIDAGVVVFVLAWVFRLILIGKLR